MLSTPGTRAGTPTKMKTVKLLTLFVVGAALVGCSSEEPAEPLSPTAQAALKSGHTGPPPQAQGTMPGHPSGSPQK